MGTPVKISALPPRGELAETDVFPASAGGITYRVSLAQLAALLGGTQSLSYNPTSGVLAISGANSVTIVPNSVPVLTTSSASLPYTIPGLAGLDWFAIKSDVDGFFSLSIAPGAADQLENEPLAAGVWQTHTRPIFGGDAGQVIYFEGLTGNVSIKIFLDR